MEQYRAFFSVEKLLIAVVQTPSYRDTIVAHQTEVVIEQLTILEDLYQSTPNPGLGLVGTLLSNGAIKKAALKIPDLASAAGN